MKVFFHPRFYGSYTHDPAASPGRMEAVTDAIGGCFPLSEPEPARDADIQLVHTKAHVERVKDEPGVYEMARLAVGGAIESAQSAYRGDASFGLIRPPGHHASPDSCWGFCYFNNVAIALKRLIKDKAIQRALILDFDLHYGDGTENAFRGDSSVVYHHPEGAGRAQLMDAILGVLAKEECFDMVAVSAGFDRHQDDWGGTLTTDDYRTIGQRVKEAALRACQGRRFGVLEGGYNHDVLGLNVKAFLEGMA